MTTTRERRQAFRTIEGWAIGILLSAGAIRECDEYGYMKERADHPRAVTKVSRCFGLGRSLGKFLR
jgi:hypothetical protein